MAGVLDGLQDGQQVRGHDALQGENLFRHLPGVAHQGLGLGGNFGDGRLGDELQPHLEMRALLEIFLNQRLGLALDQDLQAPVRELQHSQDEAHRAHGVNILRLGILHGLVLLGSQKQEAVLGQGRFNGQNRGLPAHEQGQHHVGKHHHVPHRQQGQDGGDDYLLLIVFFFSGGHVISWEMLRIDGDAGDSRPAKAPEIAGLEMLNKVSRDAPTYYSSD